MNLGGMGRFDAPSNVSPFFAKFSFEFCNCVSGQRLEEKVSRGTICFRFRLDRTLRRYSNAKAFHEHSAAGTHGRSPRADMSLDEGLYFRPHGSIVARQVGQGLDGKGFHDRAAFVQVFPKYLRGALPFS